MRSAMAGLSTGLPPAFLAPATLSRFPGQSIGGRRFGRVRRVLPAQRQLALQLRDLLLGIRDLLFLFRDLFGLTTDLLVPVSQFLAKVFDLPFEIARLRIAMPRIHPPYGSRSCSICPAKSTGYVNCYTNSWYWLAPTRRA